MTAPVSKPLSDRWEHFMCRLARRLDMVAQRLAEQPGRVIPSRRGCSAGVFFYQGQSPWWGAWKERGAFNIRLGRLEIQIDRTGN